jgi:hypothetical protein
LGIWRATHATTGLASFLRHWLNKAISKGGIPTTLGDNAGNRLEPEKEVAKMPKNSLRIEQFFEKICRRPYHTGDSV